MVALGTAVPLSGSRHDQSIPPPSLACTAAPTWPSHGRGWLRVSAAADASWRGAPQSCDRSGTMPAAAVSVLSMRHHASVWVLVEATRANSGPAQHAVV